MYLDDNGAQLILTLGKRPCTGLQGSSFTDTLVCEIWRSREPERQYRESSIRKLEQK